MLADYLNKQAGRKWDYYTGSTASNLLLPTVAGAGYGGYDYYSKDPKDRNKGISLLNALSMAAIASPKLHREFKDRWTGTPDTPIKFQGSPALDYIEKGIKASPAKAIGIGTLAVGTKLLIPKAVDVTNKLLDRTDQLTDMGFDEDGTPMKPAEDSAKAVANTERLTGTTADMLEIFKSLAVNQFGGNALDPALLNQQRDIHYVNKDILNRTATNPNDPEIAKLQKANEERISEYRKTKKSLDDAVELTNKQLGLGGDKTKSKGTVGAMQESLNRISGAVTHVGDNWGKYALGSVGAIGMYALYRHMRNKKKEQQELVEQARQNKQLSYLKQLVQLNK